MNRIKHRSSWIVGLAALVGALGYTPPASAGVIAGTFVRAVLDRVETVMAKAQDRSSERTDKTDARASRSRPSTTRPTSSPHR